MVAAGSVVDPVSAYQQWQVAVAMKAGASEGVNGSAEGVPRVDRAAATRAIVEPAPEPPSAATTATLDAWELLRSERVDWVGARERFASLTTDATLSGEQRHEARLGFVLAAVMTGEHRAAGMAARRVEVGAGVIALDAGVAGHLDAARGGMGLVDAGDREAIGRALGMLDAPAGGGAGVHAGRGGTEGAES